MDGYLLASARCDEEIWADICGYEGIYQVSNFGNIKSLDRVLAQKNRYGKQSLRSDKGKRLTPIKKENGYFYITLRKNGKRKNFYIHRLVAAAFIANPANLPIVNHKDENPGNNAADNLEWATQESNVRYSSTKMRKPKTVSKPTATGEKYISIHNSHGRKKYRVYIRGLTCKEFFTFEEALRHKNEVMKK